jgi:hypothetical protein
MNKLTEPHVEVFEHIRDTYAQFDPAPQDVLAAARGALGWGQPTPPFGWCSASRNRGGEHAAFSGCTQAQLRSAGSCRTEFSPAGQRSVREVRPATRDRRQQLRRLGAP